MKKPQTSLSTEQLRKLFAESIKAFPYPGLKPTGLRRDAPEPTEVRCCEYREEFVFPAGGLLDVPLQARGWVTLTQWNLDDITIQAEFGLAVKRVRTHNMAQLLLGRPTIQCTYNAKKRTWDCSITEHHPRQPNPQELDELVQYASDQQLLVGIFPDHNFEPRELLSDASIAVWVFLTRE